MPWLKYDHINIICPVYSTDIPEQVTDALDIKNDHINIICPVYSTDKTEQVTDTFVKI
jgi:hypothetical protein